MKHVLPIFPSPTGEYPYPLPLDKLSSDPGFKEETYFAYSSMAPLRPPYFGSSLLYWSLDLCALFFLELLLI